MEGNMEFVQLIFLSEFTDEECNTMLDMLSPAQRKIYDEELAEFGHRGALYIASQGDFIFKKEGTKND